MDVKKKKKNEGDGDTAMGEEALPFHKLLSYADGLDWVLMALGTLGSIVHGLAQPVGYLLLGKALDAYGTNIKDPEAMVDALYKVQIQIYIYRSLMSIPVSKPNCRYWMSLFLFLFV